MVPRAREEHMAVKRTRLPRYAGRHSQKRVRARQPARALKIAVLGPLFSEADKMYNLVLVEPLDEDHTVYLPQRDGGLLVEMVRRMSRERAIAIIDRKNMQAIAECDLAIFVLDGRVPDDGMLVELGVAHQMGKVCIALQTTPIRLLPQGNNPMIEKRLTCPPFPTRDELYDWVDRFARRRKRRR